MALRLASQRSRAWRDRLLLRIQVHLWRNGGLGSGPTASLCMLCLVAAGIVWMEADRLDHPFQAVTTTTAPAAGETPPVDELIDELAGRLPAAQTRPGDWLVERVRLLHELAEQKGMAWPHGRYGTPTHLPVSNPAPTGSAAGLWRIDIEQPLQGNYTDLRHYLQRVQQTWPDLALERMVLEPAPHGTPGLSARLVWSLWWRSPSDTRWPTVAPWASRTAASEDATPDRPPRQPFEWVQPELPVSLASEPTPPPVPPPLPWTYAGRQLSNEQWTVFLLGTDTTVSGHPVLARSGDTLERVWRVERIAPPDLEFIYLPLGLTVHLSIGESF